MAPTRGNAPRPEAGVDLQRQALGMGELDSLHGLCEGARHAAESCAPAKGTAMKRPARAAQASPRSHAAKASLDIFVI